MSGSVHLNGTGDGHRNGNGHSNGNGHGTRPRALVTGCAGFIGSHLTERLLADGCDVLGVDCLTEFYAPSLKQRNIEPLLRNRGFSFARLDLASDPISHLLEGVDVVFHLAAQPGVRGSFGDSFEHYVRNNVYATQRLLEAAVAHPVSAFVYASSSSVYGNAPTPSNERTARCPISPYGMTKLAAEEIAAVYHRNSGVPVIGLRYFTVYGPRQRPDMALTRFLTRALAGEPLPIVGNGMQRRDLTFVGDIVEGTLAAAAHGRPGAVYNIGGGRPVTVLRVVEIIGEILERPVHTKMLPAALGDPASTHADSRRARDELGFEPAVPLRVGITEQLRWVTEQLTTDSLEIPVAR